MATYINKCSLTGLSLSYSWRKGCKCSDCKAWKRLSSANDPKAKERSRQWRLRFPEKSRLMAKSYQARFPKQVKKWQLKKYGLTVEQYENMSERQKDLCKICYNPQEGFHKALSVDHCHKTGKIRGLLCNPCNTALGKFKESIKIMRRAINYLKENGDVYTC